MQVKTSYFVKYEKLLEQVTVSDVLDVANKIFTENYVKVVVDWYVFLKCALNKLLQKFDTSIVKVSPLCMEYLLKNNSIYGWFLPKKIA